MSARTVVPASPVTAKPRALTHAPASLLQRKCECGGSAGFENDCEDCKKKKLQRRATASGPATAPRIVHDVLRSSGQPLDESARAFFEPRFGHDFSKVRVHTDAQAQASARAVHAQAYAVGHDLVFGAGHFAPQTRSGQRLLAHELAHVVQQTQGGATREVQRKLEIGSANDTLEQEADRLAEQVASDSPIRSDWPLPPPSNGARKQVQQAADNPAADRNATAATAPPNTGLIVDDETDNVGPGQMRKSEFLDGLKDSVCAAADAELKAAGRTAQGCPFIERWIAKLRSRSSQYIERAIRKYGHRTSASTAREYFAAVGEQVRQGVRRWASTGDVSGVPPELMSEMGGGGGILGAIGGAVSSVVGAIGSAFSSVGKLFTKARDGGARQANPAAIQAQMGAGTTLDHGVRTRMESAFGHDFSNVRVHSDSRATGLASGLNARAFTIGNQVAFAAGEYKPGTLIGDALIAHELAHVLQQRGRTSAEAAHGSQGAEYKALEEDADMSAVEAVASIWQGGKKWLADLGQSAVPRLKSGLRLQRCGGRDRKLDVTGWTAKQEKDFISKNFPAKDQSFAGKILKDMLESGEVKFFDEASLKAEIAKRLETVQLLRKAQEPYGLAFDYPENAPQCFPKGAPKQGQINKAARAYWGPVQFDEIGVYYFNLTEQGKNNGYKALTTLFTTQSSMCDKTLIHCDFLASVIHFRAFADQIGVDEFNRRVKNGDIEMRLAWNGFQDLEDRGWGHSEKSISIREVRPKNENDLVIGDQVLFFNHRAYNLINQETRHEWKLENAFLIDRKGGVDYFEGHGSGIKTNHTMLIKLAQKYNEIVKQARDTIDLTKSKNATTAAAARAEMDKTFPNIKPVAGKWNIVGAGWGKYFNEELRRLDEVNPEKEADLPGLRDPADVSRMYCIKRPSEAPGDSC